MSSVFRFNIGDFACAIIRDNNNGARNSLLIKTGEHNIIIETGIGHVPFPPSPLRGRLFENLLSAGVNPTEIDFVLLTHADYDHISGAVAEDGIPAYPNARYALSRKEWEYWSSQPERLRPNAMFADFFTTEQCTICNTIPPKRLDQLHDKLQLIDWESEIVPGIHAMGIPGHTPGHTAYAVSSGGAQVIFVGDLFYNPEDIGNVMWHAAIDVDPIQSADSRERLLEEAVRNHTLLIAYHAPYPGLGRVAQYSANWRWTAVQTNTQ